MHLIEIVPREVRLQFVFNFLDEVRNIFFFFQIWVLLFRFYRFALFINVACVWDMLNAHVGVDFYAVLFMTAMNKIQTARVPNFFVATPSCLRVPTFSFSPFASDPIHNSCTIHITYAGRLVQEYIRSLYCMWALSTGHSSNVYYFDEIEEKKRKTTTEEISNAHAFGKCSNFCTLIPGKVTQRF